MAPTLAALGLFRVFVMPRLKDTIWQEFMEITVNESQHTRLGVDKARKPSFLIRQLNDN